MPMTMQAAVFETGDRRTPGTGASPHPMLEDLGELPGILEDTMERPSAGPARSPDVRDPFTSP